MLQNRHKARVPDLRAKALYDTYKTDYCSSLACAIASSMDYRAQGEYFVTVHRSLLFSLSLLARCLTSPIMAAAIFGSLLPLALATSRGDRPTQPPPPPPSRSAPARNLTPATP